MRKIRLSRYLPAITMLALLATGCAQQSPQMSTAVPPATQALDQKQDVLKGTVVGKSDKAKAITIQVGTGEQAQPVMLRFDEKTAGLQYAEKDEAVVISWEQRGDDKFATGIKPKLAQLPAGVAEIKVEEMHRLVAEKAPMTLVDARPEARFMQAHLPGSINLPVPKLQKLQAAALPKDKNSLLIFYCGGPT